MQAVVIAAGESKRFWPLNKGIHKSQFKLLGRSLLYWTLKGLEENGIKDVCVVVSKHSSIQDTLAQEEGLDMSVSYAVQEEPLGTGNALWQAKDFVKEPFILLWPYKINSKDSVKRILEECHRVKGNGNSRQLQVSGMSSTATTIPWEYGVVQFDGRKVVRVVEKPKKGEEPSDIKLSGTYLLQPSFFTDYEKVKHHEADFIEALNLYLQNTDVVEVRLEKDTPTLKYPWDLFRIMDVLFESREPVISATAKRGKNVVIEGPVHIGENTIIKDGTIIEGPAYIGDNCEIGYSNVLRGPVNVEANVKTGAFMEIKHSLVQEGTMFHSGYLGDSVVGRNCRFGAGFVSGNFRFDTKPIHNLPKLGAIIGDNSAFGIHSGTMPGVLIGSNCQIGPAAHVFENIEDNTIFYTKGEKVVKKKLA